VGRGGGVRPPVPAVSAPLGREVGPVWIYDAAGARGRLTGGSRFCACYKGRRLGVRWDTGELTYECDRFVRRRPDGDLEITSQR